MANRILIKRSTSTGVAPSAGALSLGELAINTFDGRLFAKRDNGSASVIDLTRNDPIRVLGDATSTYGYDQSTYTSNVTITLADTTVAAGTYGNVTNGVVNVPKFTVDSKGRVTGVTTESFSAAANLGTIATQDANNVSISGGSIDGTAIGATTASTGRFTNVTVTGTLNSNDLTSANITLTGDATIGGSATINGDLTVLGTTTTVNSTAVSIADVNLTLAKDASNSAQADGAGLTVAGANATLTYVSTGDKWSFNKALFAPSLDIGAGDFTVDASGNIVSAGLTATTGAFSSTLSAAGDFAVNTNKFTVTAASGNTSIAGTLNVDGASTLASAAVTNNATVGGTLGVTGATTLSSTLGVTGAATLSSTLNVSGASTLASAAVTNNATVGGTLGVTGASTLGTVSAGNTAITGTLSASDTVSFSSLTAGGLVFVNSAGALATDSGFTYNPSTDSLTLQNLTINGTTSLAGISSSAVSATQIVYGGTGGAFKGEAAFTYAEATNTVSAGNISLTDDATVGGALSVTGNGTIGGTLGTTGSFAVATNKFTVNSANGNTAVAGTLSATGDTTLSAKLAVTGNVAINTDKFTVTASNGNTGIAGVLTVQGGTVLSSTLDVTGAAEFAAAVNLTANVGATLGNYSTGSLKVLGDGSVNGKLQVSGAIYKAGYEVLNTEDTIDGGTF